MTDETQSVTIFLGSVFGTYVVLYVLTFLGAI